MRSINLFIKRMMDFWGSLIGMILISPLMLVIAAAIKITSKGPVLFRQKRLGKNGVVFEILKFRTMVIDAESIGDGIFVKTEEDKRITKVGNFLRSTSLDELPQLWNVFIGQMSLVGPRPPLPHHPYEYSDYSDSQRKRFEMRPGITGLAQVTVRNSVSWDQRILIDIKYVEKFNILLDIEILFKTVQKVINRESIYATRDSKITQ